MSFGLTLRKKEASLSLGSLFYLRKQIYSYITYFMINRYQEQQA